jgi:hypothetical protein
LSGGRHRYRIWGSKSPHGLRPLTVVALCSLVAVLAVWATEATHPYGIGGNTSLAAPNQDGTDDSPTVADDGSSDEPTLATDSGSNEPSDSPSPDATTEPAPAPAPPAAPNLPNAGPPPPPPAVPTPQPVPDPTTTRPTPSPSPAPPAPPPGPVSFEAESTANSLIGTHTFSCAPCSGGKKVGYVGKGNVLSFNNVSWGNGGSVLLVLSYVNGDPTSRSAYVSVNGGTAAKFYFKSTSNWNNVGTLTLKVTLRSGMNRISITSPSTSSEYGPDFDRITVRAP